MRRKSLEAGFTLLEIGLALSIALLASAAVITMFNQVKESSGDAAMKVKIGDLQAVVESLYSAQGACPDLATMQQVWYAKRPDALASPWGGDINDVSNPPPGGCRAGLVGGPIQQGTPVGSTENSVGPGALYYYYLVEPGNIPNAALSASLYDVSVGATVSITGYGVAGIKHNGWRHFMVTSGR